MQFGKQHFGIDVRTHIKKATIFGSVGSILFPLILDLVITVELAEVTGI